MRILAVVACCGLATAADLDPREIVRRSARLDEGNYQRSRNYTFLERSETRQRDASGGARSKESKTWDVTLQEGSPYRRLVRRNDQALPPAEERQEEEKLRKSIEERRKESEAQRASRVAEWEKRRARFRELFHEVPDAFDFRLLGEESRAGRRAWVIEAQPRPGYRPRSRAAKLFPHFRGKLWIDATDYHWVRTEAESIDTVSFGWFLARLAPGSRVEIDQVKVNDDVWLPQRVLVSAAARLGLVKKVTLDQEVVFSNYRKFQTDSSIISATEITEPR